MQHLKLFVIDNLLGDLDSLPLKDKFFRITQLFALMISILGGINNFLTDIGGIKLLLMNLSMTVLCTIILYFSVTKNIHLKSLFLIIGSAIIYVNWIFNAGSFGSTQFLIILPTFFAFLIFDGKTRIIATTLTLLTMPVSLFIEQSYPAIIIPYADLSDRPLDVVFGFGLIFAALATLFNTIIIILNRERQKTYRLLLNSFPKLVARELHKNNSFQAVKYEQTSMLFINIINFTHLTKVLPSNEIVLKLNALYSSFDTLAQKHGVQRIKTIGGVYFTACGIPACNPLHLENILRYSLGVLALVKQQNQHLQEKWQIRLGIHTGPAIGGVVGNTAYQLDVFGNTVNLASKIEKSCEPMTISVSEDVYKKMSDQFIFGEKQLNYLKGGLQFQTYSLEGIQKVNEEERKIVQVDSATQSCTEESSQILIPA